MLFRSTITFVIYNVPSVELTPTDLSCFESSDGTINVSVTGVSPSFPYSWDNGVSSASGSGTTNPFVITGLNASNNYDITVSSPENCSVTASTSITQPNELVVTVDGVGPTCFGDNDGTLTSGASGGTLDATITDYIYNWTKQSDNSSLLGASQNTLTVDTYTLTVSDANNCTVTETFTLTTTDPINLSTVPVDAGCGTNDGSITVTASGGSGDNDWNYVWEGPAGVDMTGETTSAQIGRAHV